MRLPCILPDGEGGVLNRKGRVPINLQLDPGGLAAAPAAGSLLMNVTMWFPTASRGDANLTLGVANANPTTVITAAAPMSSLNFIFTSTSFLAKRCDHVILLRLWSVLLLCSVRTCREDVRRPFFSVIPQTGEKYVKGFARSANLFSTSDLGPVTRRSRMCRPMGHALIYQASFTKYNLMMGPGP